MLVSIGENWFGKVITVNTNFSVAASYSVIWTIIEILCLQTFQICNMSELF